MSNKKEGTTNMQEYMAESQYYSVPRAKLGRTSIGK